MLARIAISSVVFGLLVACGGAIETEDQAPTIADVVDEKTGQVSQQMRSAGGACECDLAAGSKVWKCNGQCSDKELKNLPH